MDITELEFIPRWLGEPLYPGGFPLRSEDVNFEGKSAKDIYFCKKHSETEKEFLKQYMIYVCHAPVFDNELTQELKDKDLMSMDLDTLWYELMSVGLDPF